MTKILLSLIIILPLQAQALLCESMHVEEHDIQIGREAVYFDNDSDNVYVFTQLVGKTAVYLPKTGGSATGRLYYNKTTKEAKVVGANNGIAGGVEHFMCR